VAAVCPPERFGLRYTEKTTAYHYQRHRQSHVIRAVGASRGGLMIHNSELEGREKNEGSFVNGGHHIPGRAHYVLMWISAVYSRHTDMKLVTRGLLKNYLGIRMGERGQFGSVSTVGPTIATGGANQNFAENGGRLTMLTIHHRHHFFWDTVPPHNQPRFRSSRQIHSGYG